MSQHVAPFILCVVAFGCAQASQSASPAPMFAPAPHVAPDECKAMIPPREVERGTIARALYAEGVSLLQRNLNAEALAKFSECQTLDPVAGCLRALGIVHARLGNVADSNAAYRRYLELSPDAPDRKEIEQILGAHERGASGSVVEGQPHTGDLVATWLEHAPIDDKTFAQQLHAQAETELARGWSGHARPLLRRCLEVHPLPACYRTIGELHTRSGNNAEAALCYRRYLDLLPEAADRQQIEQRLQGL